MKCENVGQPESASRHTLRISSKSSRKPSATVVIQNLRNLDFSSSSDDPGANSVAGIKDGISAGGGDGDGVRRGLWDFAASVANAVVFEGTGASESESDDEEEDDSSSDSELSAAAATFGKGFGGGGASSESDESLEDEDELIDARLFRFLVLLLGAGGLAVAAAILDEVGRRKKRSDRCYRFRIKCLIAIECPF